MSESTNTTKTTTNNSMQSLEHSAPTIPTTWVLLPGATLQRLMGLLSSSELENLMISAPLPVTLPTVTDDPPNQEPPVQELSSQMTISVVAPMEMVMTATVNGVISEESAMASAELVAQTTLHTGTSTLTRIISRDESRYPPHWHNRAIIARRVTGTLDPKPDWRDQQPAGG